MNEMTDVADMRQVRLRAEALDALITGESAFADLPAVLARLSRDPGAALCQRISYPAG